jgi:DNA-binding MarR family transcriptional regulator
MGKALTMIAVAAKPREALAADAMALADALHAASWVMLRRLRPLERLEGVSVPAIWALNLIVLNPAITPSEIAEAEGVSLPTVSRALKELDGAGLVERRADPNDARTQRLHATALGVRRLKDGRRRRVGRLAAALQKLPEKDRAALARAAVALRALGEL